jgi:predicted peptidase
LEAKVYAKVGNQGWYPEYFELPVKPKAAAPEDFVLTVEQHGEKVEKVIRSVEAVEGGLRIFPEPFSYSSPFSLQGQGAAKEIHLEKPDVAGVTVEGLECFEDKRENGVLYRLYMPGAGPRPLLLFLHGGGESGSDNFKQMVGTVGALRLAERYPDFYVMAPQAPAPAKPPSMPTRQSFGGMHEQPRTGWHREYLAAVCDIIRGMVAAGQVDPARIFVTGMSMGGGGTIRMLSVGSGLFAAAAPVCPTMTPETYNILRSLTDTKIWVSTAYVDHSLYRHKYIVDAILALKDAGNKDARLTLFSPEELAAYGLGVGPEISLERKFGENHACWMLVYSGEHGILDWLVSQHR